MQRLLARTIKTIVHLATETKKAEHTSETLFAKEGDLRDLEEAELLAAFANIPQIHVDKEHLLNTDIINLLSNITNNKIFESKSEVRTIIKSGGLLINKSKVVDHSLKAATLLIYNKYVVVQKRKKNYLIVCQ